MATTKTIQATVKNRTDTVTNWTQKNPVLTEGEIVVVQMNTGETRLKIGDGTKTFTQLPYADEQIYNNVVTSVNGQTGNITMNSVEYTPQTLTDAQKKQARENVDAASAFAPILTSPVMIRKFGETESAGVYLSTIDTGEKWAEIRLEDVNENAPVAIANLRTPTGAGKDDYAATKGYVDSKVASGSGVTVDTAMSGTSTNPVQNKVIKQYVDAKADKTALDAKLDKTGGTLTGNLTGKYITGTWLQSTAASDLGRTPGKIAVLDDSGWVYYRTPSELFADLGIANAIKSYVDTAIVAAINSSY